MSVKVSHTMESLGTERKAVQTGMTLSNLPKEHNDIPNRVHTLPAGSVKAAVQECWGQRM